MMFDNLSKPYHKKDDGGTKLRAAKPLVARQGTEIGTGKMKVTEAMKTNNGEIRISTFGAKREDVGRDSSGGCYDLMFKQEMERGPIEIE